MELERYPRVVGMNGRGSAGVGPDAVLPSAAELCNVIATETLAQINYPHLSEDYCWLMNF